MRQVRLYLYFLEAYVENMMQHKMSFPLMTAGQFLVLFNVFLGVFFMMGWFHQVNGFTYLQVLLCFVITLSSSMSAEAFLHGFDVFSSMVGNGEFDRVLLHPVGPIYQVLCSKFELTHVGRLLQAIVMLAYAIPRSQVDWTRRRVMILVTMITGGTAVSAGIFIIYASLYFFTLESLEFANMFTDGTRECGKYLIGIYGRAVLAVCIYLVPFALFQYYPFLYLMDISHNWWYAYLSFTIFPLLTPSLMLWWLRMRYYQFTGS